jgi:hypothetical protein
MLKDVLYSVVYNNKKKENWKSQDYPTILNDFIKWWFTYIMEQCNHKKILLYYFMKQGGIHGIFVSEKNQVIEQHNKICITGNSLF